jgi:hypothetical protein
LAKSGEGEAACISVAGTSVWVAAKRNRPAPKPALEEVWQRMKSAWVSPGGSEGAADASGALPSVMLAARPAPPSAAALASSQRRK